jgi:hypothetical protein
MHTLRFRSASGALCEFVRAYAQRDLDAGLPSLMEFCPARIEQELEFQFRAPFRVCFSEGRALVTPRIALIGAYTQSCKVAFTQRVETFAVLFQPAGFSRLFDIPIGELSNRVLDPPPVLGTFWNHLAESLRSRSVFGSQRRCYCGRRRRFTAASM